MVLGRGIFRLCYLTPIIRVKKMSWQYGLLHFSGIKTKNIFDLRVCMVVD